MNQQAPLEIPLILQSGNQPSQQGTSSPVVQFSMGENEVQYDGDAIPPNFEISKKHGKANRVYKSAEETHEHHDDHDCDECPCCGKKDDGEQLSIFCKISDLYHLGSGYALYFNFLKYTIGLLVVMFAVGGAYNLITNISQDDCPETLSNDTLCDAGLIIDMSLANKRDAKALMTGQVLLNLGVVLCVMVVFHLMRRHLRQIIVDADDQAVTPADYTVLISGIPKKTEDKEIETYIESLSTPEQPIEWRKITRASNIEGYAEMEFKKDALLKEKKACRDEDRKLMIEREVEQILANWQSRLDGLEDKYTDKAYVSFTKAVMADHLIAKFKKEGVAGFFQRVNPFPEDFAYLKGEKITLERAAEPDDILWENLGYSDAHRLKNKAVTLVASLLILVASFFAILGLYWLQKDVSKKEPGSYLALALYYGTSVIICVINTVLSTTIRILAGFEKNTTKTGYLTAIAKKQSIALVINTAFTSLLVQIALGASEDGGYIGSIEELNIYGPKGLIEGMFSVFVINAIYTPLYDIFDPFYVIKLVQQKVAVHKGEDAIMTQEEANTLFEGTQSNLSLKYSSLIKTMLLTCFYAPAMPIAIPITIFGLFLSYCVDKYMLLRRNALPASLGDELSTAMIEYLEWMCFTFSAGNIMFLLTLQDGYNVLLWITFGISLIHIFLPMDMINEAIFKIPTAPPETKTFDEARGGFITDYDIQNPITQKLATSEVIKQSKDRKDSKSLFKIKKMLTMNKNVNKNLHAMIFQAVLDNDEETVEEKGGKTSYNGADQSQY